MRINHNISALNTYGKYNLNTASASKSMEKLSSGLRINRAADDAAGLSISEKMRSQIAGLNQASRNAQDGISYIQTAEGALNEVSNMLVRLKELAVQVTNGTYSTKDKENIGQEMNALGNAIDDIFSNTKFNGTTVFGTNSDIKYGEDAGSTLTIAKSTTQTGTGTIAVPVGTDGAFHVLKLYTDAAVGGTANPAGVTVARVDAAIDEVNTQRAVYGAQQNQLEHVVNNQNTTGENLQAAESRIRDVDMAKEMTEYTKNNILVQAAQAMLAQANSQPQGVLQLLRG